MGDVFKKFHLKQNIRSETGDSEFSKFLLDIWEGIYPEINNSHDIEIPSPFHQVVKDTDTLVQSIYEDMCERSRGESIF